MKMRSVRVKNTLLSTIFLLFVLVFVALINNTSDSASAIDKEYSEKSDTSHYISLHIDGSDINIRSNAATVRDALSLADITLMSGDKVEPALDEPISSDDFNINIYRARDVLVIDGNHRRQIRTASTSPVDVANDAGFELLEADKVVLVPYNNLLESGSTNAYKIKRAKVVHLSFFGEKVDVRTQTKTVKALLEERNIDSDSSKNWISVSLDTKIVDGMEFSILPQGIQSVTVEEEIAFSEQVVKDYDLEYGKREVIKYGQNGMKTVTYEVNMQDGVELSRTKLSEIVTKEPVAQEVRLGMKINLPSGSHEDWMASAGIAASDYGYVNYIIMHESSWRPDATNGKYWGLYQTTKARLISDCGENWVNDPVCQLRSATGYATGRYGSWENAYNFWRNHGWW